MCHIAPRAASEDDDGQGHCVRCSGKRRIFNADSVEHSTIFEYRDKQDTDAAGNSIQIRKCQIEANTCHFTCHFKQNFKNTKYFKWDAGSFSKISRGYLFQPEFTKKMPKVLPFILGTKNAHVFKEREGNFKYQLKMGGNAFENLKNLHPCLMVMYNQKASPIFKT